MTGHTNSTKTQLPLGSESGLLNNGFDNIRFRRGNEIAHRKNQIQETDKFQYIVKSQSTSGEYEVQFTELDWICSCADHRFRAVTCKHIYAVLIEDEEPAEL